MGDSILEDIKELLGSSRLDTAFDKDIIIHINSVFFILNQLGIGKEKEIFKIINNEQTWNDFLVTTTIPNELELIKSYIYINVRLLFDPPTNSFLIDALNNQKIEYAWRLNEQIEKEKEITNG